MVDEGSEAETDLNNREMYFKATDSDTILHELAHIYFRGTYIRYTSNMDVADFEEIAVSLFADRGRLMFKQAEEIEIKLKELSK